MLKGHWVLNEQWLFICAKLDNSSEGTYVQLLICVDENIWDEDLIQDLFDPRNSGLIL